MRRLFPPTQSWPSRTVTSCPARASNAEVARPPSPAPITTMREVTVWDTTRKSDPPPAARQQPLPPHRGTRPSSDRAYVRPQRSVSATEQKQAILPTEHCRPQQEDS